MEEVDTARVLHKGPETDAAVMTTKLVRETQEEALSRFRAAE